MKNRKNIKTTTCLLTAVFLFTSCKSAEQQNPSVITPTTVNETISEATKAQHSTSESELQTEGKVSSKEDVTEEAKEKEENIEKTDSSSENIIVENPIKETEESLTEQSSEEQNEPEESFAQPDRERNVQDIYNEIIQTVDLNSPMILPDNFISNYYGIDVSTLEEYVFSMSEAAISAETIIILKVKDGVSTESLTASLQVVIDQKKAEMENYLPEQFQIVEKSLIQVKDNYVYLVISEQADAISRIIQAGIE